MTDCAMQCRLHCMAEDSSRSDAQVTFRLPQSVADRLERLATVRGVQRSDLLRQAAERLLADEQDAVHRYELVKDLVGSLRSGVGDLGTHHRKHLKRAFRRGR
ncbi:MAG TPA: CopG family transcriptional regulator [Polyangiaceae bacterium]